MVVVVILGLLASIAATTFADLIRKANEGAVKGDLGGLRSALSVYYSESEGQWPPDLQFLKTNEHYIPNVPAPKVPPYHLETGTEHDGPPSILDDTGGWIYDNVYGDPYYGKVLVNCSHTDTKGLSWSTF